ICKENDHHLPCTSDEAAMDETANCNKKLAADLFHFQEHLNQKTTEYLDSNPMSSSSSRLRLVYE
ncbi:hypothetical protein Dimus_024576, partial [Dionaea muscipula]